MIMPLHRKGSPPRRRRSRSHSPRQRSVRSRSRSRTPEKNRRRSPVRRNRSPPKYSRPRSPGRRPRSPPHQQRLRSPKEHSDLSIRHHSFSPKSRSQSPLTQPGNPKFGGARKRSWSRSPSPFGKSSRSSAYSQQKLQGPPQKYSKSPSSRRKRSISRSPPHYEKRSSSSHIQMDRTQRNYSRPMSRSLSPQVRKSSKESEREFRGRSPSPKGHSPYGGKIYSDGTTQKSKSSSSPVKRERRTEISAVYIVETKRKEKLNDRFQTLEQIAQGPFEIDENITIGIHRGHHHVVLDEDVPVDYSFNPKAFKMRYERRDYTKSIFDRDEIKAFHHDDILDDQAYVEKRTVTVRPVQKKSRYQERSDSDRQYRITVGNSGHQDRFVEQEDKRRVLDRSSSSGRLSRPGGYSETSVTVRLDPKPDPRYESLYEKSVETSQPAPINPNDLRYSLTHRRHGSDSDTGASPADARKKIEARRQGPIDQSHRHSSGHRDLSERLKNRQRREESEERMKERKFKRERHISRSRSPDRRNPVDDQKEEKLPDFKNRPGKYQYTDWKNKPEEIPKGINYYEHDNRDRNDLNYWERKQMYLEHKRKRGAASNTHDGVIPFRSRGIIPRSRGGDRGRGRRPFRSRGFGFRGRGSYQKYPQSGQGFIRRDSNTSSLGEWKHDMFEKTEKKEENSQSAENTEKID